MSDQQGIEKSIDKTFDCASAKILGELDGGVGNASLRRTILWELNGLRRFVTKLVRAKAKGPLLLEEDASRDSG